MIKYCIEKILWYILMFLSFLIGIALFIPLSLVCLVLSKTTFSQYEENASWNMWIYAIYDLIKYLKPSSEEVDWSMQKEIFDSLKRFFTLRVIAKLVSILLLMLMAHMFAKVAIQHFRIADYILYNVFAMIVMYNGFLFNVRRDLMFRFKYTVIMIIGYALIIGVIMMSPYSLSILGVMIFGTLCFILLCLTNKLIINVFVESDYANN